MRARELQEKVRKVEKEVEIVKELEKEVERLKDSERSRGWGCHPSGLWLHILDYRS